MKKIQKVIIMISVLLAPIFVFLFLKEYGTNKFELPVYYSAGIPISDCNLGEEPHIISLEILSRNNFKLPALIYVPAGDQNEYYSDLNNVLTKYSDVHVIAVISEGSLVASKATQTLSLASDAYDKFINCALVLGEDHRLKKPITNKYVLIDLQGRIRGYYNCEELDEIERLDVELDILVNY